MALAIAVFASDEIHNALLHLAACKSAAAHLMTMGWCWARVVLASDWCARKAFPRWLRNARKSIVERKGLFMILCMSCALHARPRHMQEARLAPVQGFVTFGTADSHLTVIA